jgi:hypothetical protein
MNTQLANQALQYNKVQRPQSQYAMQTGQMAALAGGLQNAGQMQNQNSLAQYGANTQLLGSLISAGGTAAGGYLQGRGGKTDSNQTNQPSASNPISDVRVKEDIRESDDVDLDNFLKKLVPYRFKYKEDTGLPQDDRLGVMAQDLEKSRVGSEIVKEDSDNVKNIDLMEAVPKILASLGYLNKKIDERTR